MKTLKKKPSLYIYIYILTTLIFSVLFTQKCYAEESSTDNGNFEFSIPSEISVTQKDNKLEGTIPVTVTTHNRKWLSVDIKSENNFNLVGKTEKQKLPYQLSETSFDVNPQYDVDNDNATTKKEITLSSSETTTYADDYSDQVNFVVSSVDDTQTIVLDCNGGNVNGKSEVIYTVKTGNSYGQLPVPSKTNSTFLKWVDEKENTIYSGSQVTTETEKLTAKWSAKYMVYFYGFLNGNRLNYTQGVATADIYVNGKMVRQNNQLNYFELKEGDTFEINNIQCMEGYKISGLKGEENSLYRYEYDNEGNLLSFSGTIKENYPLNNYLYMEFYADTELNNLLKQTNTSKIFIDDNKPSECTPIGSITIFGSNASVYLLDDTLHIYNPDGGKIVLPENCSNLFTGTVATEMDMHNFDASHVQTTFQMFINCTLLKQLNVSGWDTINLNNMQYTFLGCNNLLTIDLNTWNTSNVTSLYGLFWDCNRLQTVGVSEIDVSNVKTFFRTFGHCSNLKSVDLSKWDTSSAENLGAMFESCGNLTELDLSNFNTKNVKYFYYMFDWCTRLKHIKGLEKFDTSKALNMSYMFYYLPSLEEFDISKFVTSNVNYMDYMFSCLTKLTELDLQNFDTRNLISASQMFSYCPNLEKIYVSNKFSTNKLSSSERMFANCTSLTGGSGTVFDPTFIDGTAARIDGGSESPGYFTDIADKQDIATYSIEQTIDEDFQDNFGIENEIDIPVSSEELPLE